MKKEDIKKFYSINKPFWFLVSGSPLVASIIYALVNKTPKEILFGGITSVVFTAITLGVRFLAIKRGE